MLRVSPPARFALFLVAAGLPLVGTAAAQVRPSAPPARPPLTVAGVMALGEELRTGLPTGRGWDERGDHFYFDWNPASGALADSLYRVARGGRAPEKVPAARRRAGVELFNGWRHGEFVYTADLRRKVFTRDGDVYVLDRTTGAETRLTDTPANEQAPRFTPDGRAVVYRSGDNLYQHRLDTGALEQLTDVRSGNAPATPRPTDAQAVLNRQQEALFATIRDRAARRRATEAAAEADRRARGEPRPLYLAGRALGTLALDPTGRYAAYTLGTRTDAKNTEVPAWVTESGYVEDLNARPKVGQPLGAPDLFVWDLAADTARKVDLYTLPGTSDKPAYRRAMGDTAEARRGLGVLRVTWRPDGRLAVVEVRAHDNKTRWLASLDPASAALTPLDVQQDDAWVGGPGVNPGGTGWMADGRTFYFQSEKTGYSHLYAVDTDTRAVRALTSGAFEVSNVQLSRDGREWTFDSAEASPYERHRYAMPAAGGARTRLTPRTGQHTVFPDPREERLAMLFGTANTPPEVYLARPRAGAYERVTTSTSAAFRAYPWRDAEIVEVPASDGARVPARIYRPAAPNGAAVLFVHGAGYLQNVHRGWSTYYREYLFHHLLAERGYTVLDLDYRASAGYGRDWRTGIYRHMGGRDLQDYVDASRYVGAEFGVRPDRVFIYGGSYGGFITLMALLTEPDHFGGGAALRSVTDWAHYNHGYTANILNTPALDSLAYARSSPINFAEGYQGDPLLIAHGMVDTNVHFQDVVRLAQRFIELGKTGWEMAVYPVEDHGFVEQTSWTDEYRRILQYIEESVGPNRRPRVVPE